MEKGNHNCYLKSHTHAQNCEEVTKCRITFASQFRNLHVIPVVENLICCIFSSAKFANNLRTFEVIVPTKVDDEGEVVSHHLHQKTIRRWKRDAEIAPTEKVHYNLEVIILACKEY